MKSPGASSTAYFVLSAIVLIFILFVPYPYYSPSTNMWYAGPSIVQRLLGANDNGVPFEQVVTKVSAAAISSPFDNTCNFDSDCTNYAVVNACQVYCGNTNSTNKAVETQLNNNRICDPAGWNRPNPPCKCVFNKCTGF